MAVTSLSDQRLDRALLELDGGSLTIGAGHSVSKYRSLFAGDAGNFPLVGYEGRAYRMLAVPGATARHRQVTGFTASKGLTIRSLDDRPLPLQVDGDYIGEAAEAVFSVEPGALLVIS